MMHGQKNINKLLNLFLCSRISRENVLKYEVCELICHTWTVSVCHLL